MPTPSPVSTSESLTTCPLCHTVHRGLTDEAVQAGADWRCVRCEQLWNAGRLAAADGYQTWAVQHDSLRG